MTRAFSNESQSIVPLASILAATAGIVNAVGFFAFDTLVTNVTGHFARIAHDIVEGDYVSSLEKVLWVVAFFLGGFASTALMVPARRRGATFVFAAPIAVEAVVLVGTVLLGPHALVRGVLHANALTACLLFAMGLQNATVTVISGTVVRTTHLTGTLTDIGVNAGRYVFDRTGEERPSLGQKLRLHLSITGAFTLGALVGGVMYHQYRFRTLVVALALLGVAWIYDEYFYHLELRARALSKV